jgi:DNA-binding protein HU-beta
MNKPEPITTIAKETRVKKQEVDEFINVFTKVVKRTLKKGEKVILIGFGSYGIRERENETIF